MEYMNYRMSAYLIWQEPRETYQHETYQHTTIMQLTPNIYSGAYPDNLHLVGNVDVILVRDASITGNISNNLITYDKPAAVPPALYVRDMNVSSNNKAGCFSTNLLIANDTIKIEGRVRDFLDLWRIYGATKWSKSQKVFGIATFSHLSQMALNDRKIFAVQITDLNWAIKSGFGDEIDFTINLKVVDQKSDNPIA